VGVVTVTIPKSINGVTPATSFIALPLLQAASFNGTMSGVISSVSATTISLSGANWTAGELAQQSSPVYIQIKSGSQQGLVLKITSNTDSTLTVDTQGLSLGDLGIQSGASGDRCDLLLGDTMRGLLGDPADGIVGGNSSQFTQSLTDKVLALDSSGIVRTFYYNTDFNQWRRSGSSQSQDNVAISPVSGILFYRIGTDDIALQTSGTVPIFGLKNIVPNNKPWFHARYFPTDGTLSDLGFEQLPTWRNTSQSGVTIATADKIVARDGSGIVRQFYHDGTNWRRSGSSAPQNTAPLPTGACVYTLRFGQSASPEIAAIPVPYIVGN